MGEIHKAAFIRKGRETSGRGSIPNREDELRLAAMVVESIEVLEGGTEKSILTHGYNPDRFGFLNFVLTHMGFGPLPETPVQSSEPNQEKPSTVMPLSTTRRRTELQRPGDMQLGQKPITLRRASAK